MRSLSGLKARIADLLRARAELAARPHVVAFIPRNGREPTGWPDGTFTTRTSPYCSVVHYDPSNPPAELITAREQDATVSENRTENHAQKGTP